MKDKTKIELLNVVQIAEYLGVKTSTIYQWTHQEYIPFIKVGRFLRFDMNSIKQWLIEQTVTGRSKVNPFAN